MISLAGMIESRDERQMRRRMVWKISFALALLYRNFLNTRLSTLPIFEEYEGTTRM